MTEQEMNEALLQLEGLRATVKFWIGVMMFLILAVMYLTGSLYIVRQKLKNLKAPWVSKNGSTRHSRSWWRRSWFMMFLR